MPTRLILSIHYCRGWLLYYDLLVLLPSTVGLALKPPQTSINRKWTCLHGVAVLDIGMAAESTEPVETTHNRAVAIHATHLKLQFVRASTTIWHNVGWTALVALLLDSTLSLLSKKKKVSSTRLYILLWDCVELKLQCWADTSVYCGLNKRTKKNASIGAVIVVGSAYCTTDLLVL